MLLFLYIIEIIVNNQKMTKLSSKRKRKELFGFWVWLGLERLKSRDLPSGSLPIGFAPLLKHSDVAVTTSSIAHLWNGLVLSRPNRQQVLLRVELALGGTCDGHSMPTWRSRDVCRLHCGRFGTLWIKRKT